MSVSTEEGTARPPRCARERPEAGTVRVAMSRSSSSSAPACLAREAAREAGSRVKAPSTRARWAPVRTMVLSARCPSRSPREVSTMVLPAPVSPVKAVRPGLRGSSARSMTPRFSIWSDSIMRCRPGRLSHPSRQSRRWGCASPRPEGRTCVRGEWRRARRSVVPDARAGPHA